MKADSNSTKEQAENVKPCANYPPINLDVKWRMTSRELHNGRVLYAPFHMLVNQSNLI